MARSGKNGRRKALLAMLLAVTMIFGTNSGFVYATEGGAVPVGDEIIADGSQAVANTAGEESEEPTEAATEEASEEPTEAATEQVTEEAAVTDGEAADLSNDGTDSPDRNRFNDLGEGVPEGPIALTAENFPDDNFRNALIDGRVLRNKNDGYITIQKPDGGIPYILADDVANDVKVYLDGEKYDTIRSLQGLELIPNIYNIELRKLPKVTELPEIKDKEKLISLFIYKVGLNSLDLSGMTNLESMTLKSMYDSGLNRLDLSHNSKLQKLELTKVYLDGLDLSKNTELETISIDNAGLSNFLLPDLPNLEKLTMDTLGWGTIILPNLPSLKELRARDCNLLEGGITGLENVKTLKKIDLDGSRIKKVTLSTNELPEYMDLGEKEDLEEVNISFGSSWISTDSYEFDFSYCSNLKKISIIGEKIKDSVNPDPQQMVYNLFACEKLEDVNIRIGEGEKYTVSADVIYDFRCVNQDFEEDRFNIQSEAESGTGTVTVKCTEGSWIANHFAGSQQEAKPTATGVKFPKKEYNPAYVGDDISLRCYTGGKTYGVNEVYYAFYYTEQAEDEDGPYTRSILIPEKSAPQFTLTSNNTSVASVNNETKKIHINKPGSATITLKSTDPSLSGTFIINAIDRVNSVVMNPESVNVLKSGGNVTVKATTKNSDNTDVAGEVWWHVYDKDSKELMTPDGISIASTRSGAVTTANITVANGKLETGKYTIKANARSNKDVSGNLISGQSQMIINSYPAELYLDRKDEAPAWTGDEYEFLSEYGVYDFSNKKKIYYDVYDSSEHQIDYRNVIITSSAPGVAKVEGNKVKIKGPGTAVITVSCKDNANAKRTVKFTAYNKVTGITIDPASIEMYNRDAVDMNKGTSKEISAKISPATGADGSVWWHVYDENDNELTTDDGITVETKSKNTGTTKATVSVAAGTRAGVYRIEAASTSNRDENGELVKGSGTLKVYNVSSNVVTLSANETVAKIEVSDDNKNWKTVNPFNSRNDRPLYVRATLAPGLAAGYDIDTVDLETTGISKERITRIASNTGTGVYTFSMNYNSDENASVMITPKPVYTAKITLDDKDKGITGLQYSVNGGTWTNYPAAGVARIREGLKFAFRFKAAKDYALSAKAGYDTVSLNYADGYHVGTIEILDAGNKDISIGAYIPERYFKLTNMTTSLTGEAVQVDSGTAGSAYFADDTKKIGVLKDGTAGYRVFDYKGGDFVTLTVKAASGYAPVLAIYDEKNGSLLDELKYDPLKVSDDHIAKKTISGNVVATIKQDSKTAYTLSFRKDLLSPYKADKNERNTSYVTISDVTYNGGMLYVSGNKMSFKDDPKKDHFTVVASSAGRVLETVSDNMGDKGYSAMDNGSISVTVTPVEGYVIDAASLVNETTGKATAVKTAAGGFTTSVKSTDGVSQRLDITYSAKRIPYTLSVNKLGKTDEFEAVEGWTAADKQVKATATAAAYTYTDVTYSGGIDPGRTLKIGAKIGYLSTDAAVSENKLKVADLVITGGALGSSYNADTNKTVFTVPDTDSGKTLKVKMVLRDEAGNKYEIPEAYVIKVNAPLLSARIADAKVNKNETAGYTLTQEAGTRKTYNLTGITSGASIENVKAEVYKGTAARLTIDKQGPDADVTAKVDTAAKKITVSLSGNIVNNDQDKTTIILFNDMDGDGRYSLREEFLQSVTMISTASPIASITPTVKVVSATDATLTLTLGLPANMKNSFINRTGDYIYEIQMTPQAGYEKYKEQTFLVKAEDMSQAETFKMLLPLEPDNALPLEIGDGEKAVFKAEITAYAYGRPVHEIEGAWCQPEEYNLLGVSKTYNSGSATTFATKNEAYPVSLTAKMVNSKLYTGQEYEGKIVIANITPDKNASVVSDNGYRIVDTSDYPPMYWGDDNKRHYVTFDDNDYAGEDEVYDSLHAHIENGQLVVDADKLNEYLQNNILYYASNPVQIKVIAPRKDPSYDQEVSTTVKLSIEQRAITHVSGNEVTDKNVWLDNNDEEITLVKKPGTAVTKKFAINYDTDSTKAANNSFVWSVEVSSNNAIDPKQVTFNQSGQVTVDKNYVFPADGRVPEFTVRAVSKYNPNTVLECRVTLADASTADKMGELVVVAPDRATVSDNVTGYRVLARNNDAVTMSQLWQDVSSNRAYLAVLKKGVPVKDEITPDWLYMTANYNVTTSNSKILDVLNFTYDWKGNIDQSANTMKYEDGGEKFLQSLFVPGKGVGKVVLTATTPGGEKVAMNLTLKAATLGKQTNDYAEYYTLMNEEDLSPATNAKQGVHLTAAESYKAKTASISYNKTSSLFVVNIGKARARLQSDGLWEVESVGVLRDNYYNVTPVFKNASLLDSDPLTGTYWLQIPGKTATATLNGVTYTLLNNYYANAEASGVRRSTVQNGKVYANTLTGQTVNFRTSGNVKNGTGTKDSEIKYAIISSDWTNEASERMYLQYLKGDISSNKVVVSINNVAPEEASNGYLWNNFNLTFDSETPMKAGSYTLYVQYAGEGYEEDPSKILTEAKAFTVKVENPPAFTPVTAYTVEVTSIDSNTGFLFKGKNDKENSSARVLCVTNYNNAGVNNRFTTLVAVSDNGMLLNDGKNGYISVSSDKFIKADPADLKGYVTYTTDNGFTEKTVLVTLTRKISDDIVLIPAYEQGEGDAWNTKSMFTDSTSDPFLRNLPYTVVENWYNPSTKKSSWINAFKDGNGNPYKFYSDYQFALKDTPVDGMTDPVRIGTKKAGEYQVTADVTNRNTGAVQTVSPTQGKVDKQEAWIFKTKINGATGVSFNFVKNIGAKVTVSSDKVTNGARITMTINKDAGNPSSKAATLRSGSEVIVPQYGLVRVDYTLNAGYEPMVQKVVKENGAENIYDVPSVEGGDHVFDPETRKGSIEFYANGDEDSLETYRIYAVKKNWITVKVPEGVSVKYAVSGNEAPGPGDYAEYKGSFSTMAGDVLYLKYDLTGNKVLARNGIVVPKGVAVDTVYKRMDGVSSNGVDPDRVGYDVDYARLVIPDANTTEIRFDVLDAVEIKTDHGDHFAANSSNTLIRDDEDAPVGRWKDADTFLYPSYNLSRVEVFIDGGEGIPMVPDEGVDLESKRSYVGGALSKKPSGESLTLRVNVGN